MPDTQERVLRDLTTRAIPISPESIREDDRSVVAVLTTDAPTLVMDWRRWETVEEVLLMSGMERAERCPLLNNHFRYSLDDVFGSVREIATEADRVTGRLFFSKQGAEIERAWEKVREGHVTDVSIGYRVLESKDILPGETAVVAGREWRAGKTRLRISTKWQLRETSLVPIGADQAAKIRAEIAQLGVLPEHTPREEITMDEELKNPADASKDPPGERKIPPPVVAATEDGQKERAPAVNEDAIRAEGIRLERERQVSIRKLAGDDVDPEIVAKAIAEDWTPERASTAFLEAIRNSRSAPAGVNVIVADREVSAKVVGAGLALRCGLEPIDPAAREDKRKNQERIAEQGERYRSMSLIDVCRLAVQMDGGTPPANPSDLFRAAVSGGTLAYIFTTSVNASLFKAYGEAGDTSDWASSTDVANFLTHEAIDPSATMGLEKLGRGGEAEHGEVADKQETFSIGRYARQFVIDEMDIIDDRLDVLTKIPAYMGASAARMRPDMVYGTLLENPTLTRDSVAVFNAASHTNLQTSSALTEATIKTCVTNMNKLQRNGINLNLSPTYLIVPSDLAWVAKELVQSTELLVALTGSTDVDALTQPIRGRKNVISDMGLKIRIEPRLVNGVTNPSSGTTSSGSASTWFMAASPSACETIQVAYRTGTGRRPVIRSSSLTQGRWGIGYDVNLDIGVAALDHVGLSKNTA